MSGPPSAPWEDRRGMFQSGKAVHEPGRKVSNSGLIGGTGSTVMDSIRRASTDSANAALSMVDKPLSNDPQSPPASPTQSRRRSSAAGKFNNLHEYKRSGVAYEARRESRDDMPGAGGIMSGWFNSTFRGGAAAVKKPDEPAK